MTLNKGFSNLTIFFVPGGPGMRPECIKEFVNSHLSNYTVKGILFTGSGLLSRKSLSNYLIKALKQHPTDILIGHSFGAMLILSISGLEKLVKSQILISGAPNLGWRANLRKFKFSKRQVSDMIAAEKKFEMKPSENELKKMWSSWAPYYFTKSNIVKGQRWLLKQNYVLKVHLKSNVILKDYNMQTAQLLPTLLVSGKADKLTPVEAFNKHTFSKKFMLKVTKIGRAGHFCWLENPKELASVLRSFILNTTKDLK